MKTLIVFAGLSLALSLSLSAVAPVQAAGGGPCDQTILQVVEDFISLSTFGVTGSVTSNSSSFVTVPLKTDAVAVFLAEARRLGFQGQTIQQFEAWLIHAGFVRINGAEDFTIYERDRYWKSDEGCGPPPPPAVAGNTQEEAPQPPVPAFHGTAWAFVGLLGIVAMIFAAQRLYRPPFQPQM